MKFGPNEDKEVRSVHASEKKPYSEPVLLDLGTFAELTLAIASQGASDGGRLNNKKNTRS